MNLKFFFNKGAFLEFQDFSLIVFNLNLMILDYVYDLIKKFFKMFDWQLMIRANRFFTCLVETATAKLVTKALIMDNPNFWGNSKKKNKAKINWNRINAWYFWISTNSKIYFNHQIYYMFFCKKHTIIIEITCNCKWKFFDIISKNLELNHIKLEINESKYIINYLDSFT